VADFVGIRILDLDVIHGSPPRDMFSLASGHGVVKANRFF
jgi:hypothetical protein